MIFKSIVEGENLKFKCVDCDYESKILSNVLKHCGSVHENFDNRLLIRPDWVFSQHCAHIFEYLKENGLVCTGCKRVFTTHKVFAQHKNSICNIFQEENINSKETREQSTQTSTEYMSLEEEVIVLRREYKKLKTGITTNWLFCE